MRPLVLLWGCLVLPGYAALQGPKEISAFEGDTVSLHCTYGEELRKHKKYWCREAGILISRCSSTIYTEDDQEVTLGRVSIRDSPQNLTITVTLRNLILQDTGKYWCGAHLLGLDETLLVSLIVSPGKEASASTTGPCCPPSPAPSFQPPPAPRSLQPKAIAWHTQPPELRSSRPAIQLHSTVTEDTNPVPRSSSSKPRVSIPMARMLAPVLVLLSLLLTAGLIAFGSHMLQRRQKAQLATETQRNEKVYLPASPLGTGWATEDNVINLAGPPGPLTIPEPSVGPHTKIRYLSQTTEEEDAPSQAPEKDVTLAPPLQVSKEAPGFSEFISV